MLQSGFQWILARLERFERGAEIGGSRELPLKPSQPESSRLHQPLTGIVVNNPQTVGEVSKATTVQLICADACRVGQLQIRIWADSGVWELSSPG